MEFRIITSSDDTPFHDIMTAYYREGEDKDTPQEEIDVFIMHLFQLLMDGSISGCLVYDTQEPAGVILWMKDVEGSSFSQMPGYGTILEMNVSKSHRRKGIGKQMVAYAEQQMLLENVMGFYLCAYGPAQKFWTECGYTDTGRTAANGLPVLMKDLSGLKINTQPYQVKQ